MVEARSQNPILSGSEDSNGASMARQEPNLHARRVRMVHLRPRTIYPDYKIFDHVHFAADLSTKTGRTGVNLLHQLINNESPISLALEFSV